MKKILLSVIFMLGIFSSAICASEIDQSHAQMARNAKVDMTSEQAIDMTSDDLPTEDRNQLATVIATIIIVTIVILLSSFVTKFALSLRNDSSNIIKKQ